jgi:hypothetical protein
VGKIFLASGISTTRTIIPECLNPIYSPEPLTDYNSAKQEAKLVYGQVVEEVLRKTGGCGVMFLPWVIKVLDGDQGL